MNKTKISVFGLLVLSTAFSSEHQGTNPRFGLQDPYNDNNCICFNNHGSHIKVPDSIDPNNLGVERLVIYLYTNMHTKEIEMYIPNIDKQKVIPDLVLEKGDILKPVSSESINTILKTCHSKILVGHHQLHQPKVIPWHSNVNQDSNKSNVKPINIGPLEPWNNNNIINQKLKTIDIKTLNINDNTQSWDNVNRDAETIGEVKPINTGSFQPWDYNVNQQSQSVGDVIPIHINSLHYDASHETPNLWHQEDLYNIPYQQLYPDHIQINPVQKEQFNQWFPEQMEKINEYNIAQGHDIVDSDEVKSSLTNILFNNGLQITDDGLLTDSKGTTSGLQNLSLLPILIGKTMRLDNLIQRYNREGFTQDQSPYTQAILVATINPYKVLGTLPLGKTYLPFSFKNVIKKFKENPKFTKPEIFTSNLDEIFNQYNQIIDQNNLDIIEEQNNSADTRRINIIPNESVKMNDLNYNNQPINIEKRKSDTQQNRVSDGSWSHSPTHHRNINGYSNGINQSPLDSDIYSRQPYPLVDFSKDVINTIHNIIEKLNIFNRDGSTGESATMSPNQNPNQNRNPRPNQDPNQNWEPRPNEDPNQNQNPNTTQNKNPRPNKDPNKNLDPNQDPNQKSNPHPNQDPNQNWEPRPNQNQNPNQNNNPRPNKDQNQNWDPNQGPNQNSNPRPNQDPNQNWESRPNQDPNQNKNPRPNQDPNQNWAPRPNQEPNQYQNPNPNQNKNPRTDQDPNQNWDSRPSQDPNQNRNPRPNQDTDHNRNPRPNQDPNQSWEPRPNQDPNQNQNPNPNPNQNKNPHPNQNWDPRPNQDPNQNWEPRPNQDSNQNWIPRPNQDPTENWNPHPNQSPNENWNPRRNNGPNQDGNPHPNQNSYQNQNPNPYQNSNPRPNQNPNQNRNPRPNHDANQNWDLRPNQDPNQNWNPRQNQDPNQYWIPRPNQDPNQNWIPGPNQDQNENWNPRPNQNPNKNWNPRRNSISDFINENVFNNVQPFIPINEWPLYYYPGYSYPVWNIASRSGSDSGSIPPEVEIFSEDQIEDIADENEDCSGDFKIIGGIAATGSGTPLNNKGRSGFMF